MSTAFQNVFDNLNNENSNPNYVDVKRTSWVALFPHQGKKSGRSQISVLEIRTMPATLAVFSECKLFDGLKHYTTTRPNFVQEQAQHPHLKNSHHLDDITHLSMYVVYILGFAMNKDNVNSRSSFS